MNGKPSQVILWIDVINTDILKIMEFLQIWYVLKLPSHNSGYRNQVSLSITL